MKIKRFSVIGLLLAASLALGITAFAASNADAASTGKEEAQSVPQFHVVSEDEYAAIQAGEISLDDGIPRVWSNPETTESVCITPQFHVVSEDEYAAIQKGEISLDDGVPRVWSDPNATESVLVISPHIDR